MLVSEGGKSPRPRRRGRPPGSQSDKITITIRLPQTMDLNVEAVAMKYGIPKHKVIMDAVQEYLLNKYGLDTTIAPVVTIHPDLPATEKE